MLGRPISTSLAAMLVAIGAFSPAAAQAQIGTLLEEVCGGCGAGADFERAHRSFGSPLYSGASPSDAEAEELASSLELALREARDAILEMSPAPVPSRLQPGLERCFSTNLIESVRYLVIEDADVAIETAAFSFGHADSVTILDVVVFNRRTSDVALWSLALAHVDQLRRWGPSGLASRYIEDSGAIRDEAENIADDCAFVNLHDP